MPPLDKNLRPLPPQGVEEHMREKKKQECIMRCSMKPFFFFGITLSQNPPENDHDSLPPLSTPGDLTLPGKLSPVTLPVSLFTPKLIIPHIHDSTIP
jgi:hypothetical protein